jgi:hypothetical protein
MAMCTSPHRLCKKYPAVREALLKSLLKTVLSYYRMLAGIPVRLNSRRKTHALCQACEKGVGLPPSGGLAKEPSAR